MKKYRVALSFFTLIYDLNSFLNTLFGGNLGALIKIKMLKTSC
jgi:hypothetical protein